MKEALGFYPFVQHPGDPRLVPEKVRQDAESL
jgi:hypothetical protein